jgi:hypothetical protein
MRQKLRKNSKFLTVRPVIGPNFDCAYCLKIAEFRVLVWKNAWIEFFLISASLASVWRSVPCLLHFWWKLKYKLPPCNEMPLPFKERLFWLSQITGSLRNRKKMSGIPNTDLKNDHKGIDIARKMHVSREEFFKEVRGSTSSSKWYNYIGESFICTSTIPFFTNETSMNSHLSHPKRQLLQ